ncbi:MAG: type II toxin-antitoxin system Phd/YefM family antitoxin [Acidobacteriia bacterium]|nr:type II toxin-antitoxin system Phd/YefM family antitoxin [Terriglobia bacterium]
MKKIAAGEFKSKCLAILDKVQKSGEPVLITRHGKPVAKLAPADNAGDDIFGYITCKVKIMGDIVSPITPLEDWEPR